MKPQALPRIGDRLVVTAWAVREEVQCNKGRAQRLEDIINGPLVLPPKELGLIWVPLRLPKPIVCVCVGWVTKQDGWLDTNADSINRFHHTSAQRFPRVVLKANGPIRLAYTWRAFK